MKCGQVHERCRSARVRDAGRWSCVLACTAALMTGVAGAQPVNWATTPDVRIERVATGFRLPVNIAFVPDAGSAPADPLYYVVELYGSIKVVQRNGAVSTFASGLLDYNPQGSISGVGEQGLTGLVVAPGRGPAGEYTLYATMLWDNGLPTGGTTHYPKVERLTSAPGGLTLATRAVLLNMQPETQGQSHQISNISIGPDGKLYVHMGDGFNAGTALNLDQYRGKVLRMNTDGTPVGTSDQAGGNPFYNAANGINARDYVFTYGLRNAFGGAWQRSTGRHYFVENGNAQDRLALSVAGGSYGWSGSDTAIAMFSLYNWNPAVAPVNIAFVESAAFGGSRFPATYFDRAYVTQSGPTYASGAGTSTRKCVTEFSDLVTLNQQGKLATPPRTIARYTGTGRSTAVALAAGPDGLYFSDFYEESGAGGATASGASIFRIRHACPADVNGVGGLSVQDVFDFIDLFFNVSARADFNASGGVTVQDVFDFLESYFRGCL